MSGESSLSSVCKELDDLAVRMLDLMKQYIDLKMHLEDSIKTGSLHLAKSRYIMGNKCVSVLQLPTEDSELNAFAKVLRTDEDELRLELSRMSLESPTSTDAKLPQAKNPQDGLKRRKGKGSKESQEKDDSQPTEDKKDVPRKKEVMQDPLKWFGVLVPQNLRLAQSSFNKAVETSVEIANVQLEMDSIRQKYDRLIVAKKNLINISETSGKT